MSPCFQLSKYLYYYFCCSSPRWVSSTTFSGWFLSFIFLHCKNLSYLTRSVICLNPFKSLFSGLFFSCSFISPFLSQSRLCYCVLYSLLTYTFFPLLIVFTLNLFMYLFWIHMGNYLRPISLSKSHFKKLKINFFQSSL